MTQKQESRFLDSLDILGRELVNLFARFQRPEVKRPCAQSLRSQLLSLCLPEVPAMTGNELLRIDSQPCLCRQRIGEQERSQRVNQNATPVDQAAPLVERSAANQSGQSDFSG